LLRFKTTADTLVLVLVLPVMTWLIHTLPSNHRCRGP